MPLQQWLREVVKDAGTLGHIEELLGVQPPAEG
jgi:type VI secretion system protein ImpA